MANETFIYKLNEYAKEVYEKYNISIMFCEIFGKRWAYVAGIDEEILFENKMLVRHVQKNNKSIERRIFVHLLGGTN